VEEKSLSLSTHSSYHLTPLTLVVFEVLSLTLLHWKVKVV
jgi:hypothetical protein